MNYIIKTLEELETLMNALEKTVSEESIKIEFKKPVIYLNDFEQIKELFDK